MVISASLISQNLTQNEIQIRRQRHHERPDEHAVPGPGPPQRAHAELPERRHTLSASAASAATTTAAPAPAAAVGLELRSRFPVAGASRPQNTRRSIFVDL